MRRPRLRTKKAKRLPWWLWKPLAISLGIKLEPSSRPICGVILYALMLTSAFGFISTAGFYVFFDLNNNITGETVFSKFFSITFGLFWGTIGIYANSVAFKILTTKDLLRSIRLHSRTLFKINVGVLLTFLTVLMLCVLLYNDSKTWMDYNQCYKVEIPSWICGITWICLAIHSILATFWNLVVLICFVSISRTHVILLRRYLAQMELDAWARDRLFWLEKERIITEETEDAIVSEFDAIVRGRHHPSSYVSDDFNYLFQADLNSDSDSESVSVVDNTVSRAFSNPIGPQIQRSSRVSFIERSGIEPDAVSYQNGPDIAAAIELDSSGVPGVTDAENDEEITSVSSGTGLNLEAKSTFRPKSVHERRHLLHQLIQSNSSDPRAYKPFLLSIEELYQHYWMIERGLRRISSVFQRWVVCWCFLVACWTVSYIIYWLRVNVDPIDMILFLDPLILFVLLFSAMAEVNNEGFQISQQVYPSEERARLIKMFSFQPLQVLLFNMSISYKTLLSIILVFSVAIVSRIMVDKFKPL